MASSRLSDKDLAEIQNLAKQWGKIVVRRAFGDQGPGLDFDLDALEQVAVAAAAGLTAGTLEEATSQQAQHLPDQHPCPTCGCLCPSQTHDRPVTVEGGQFLHREPACHCPAGRRDFFPSAARAETGHPCLQHRDPSQDR
jgi:hypothetical protein